MNKFAFYMYAFWGGLFVIAGLVSTVSTQQQLNRQASLDKLTAKEIDTLSWRNVIKKITEYQPLKTAEEAAAEAAAEKERLAKLAEDKKLSLGDATLVGTVLTKPSKALLVLPEGIEPTEFKTGESWLSPWLLLEINADYIIWQNAKNNKTQKQALFQ